MGGALAVLYNDFRRSVEKHFRPILQLKDGKVNLRKKVSVPCHRLLALVVGEHHANSHADLGRRRVFKVQISKPKKTLSWKVGQLMTLIYTYNYASQFWVTVFAGVYVAVSALNNCSRRKDWGCDLYAECINTWPCMHASVIMLGGPT